LAVLGGLLLLLAGGDALVRGASGIALFWRVSPGLVGLTIVAAGTSMPELVVSVLAALDGSPGLALGNVVGSNIFNIAAILGATALFRPPGIQGNTVRLEWPVMMLAACELYLLIRDGTLDRLEGGFLVGALVAFMAYVVWIARRNASRDELEEFSDLATASFGRTGRAALWFNLSATLPPIINVFCRRDIAGWSHQGTWSGNDDGIRSLAIRTYHVLAREMGVC
jgi:cation:H+ antiporter